MNNVPTSSPRRIKGLRMHDLLIKQHKIGRKTHSSHLLKHQPVLVDTLWSYDDGKNIWSSMTLGLLQQNLKALCPYGGPGDLLYIQEAWAVIDGVTSYRADVPDAKADWGHPMHMKRGDARFWLEIVNVRALPLQMLSSELCVAEGIEPKRAAGFSGYRDYAQPGQVIPAQASFATLWNTINGPDSYERNPWVWGIEYRQIEKPADV